MSFQSRLRSALFYLLFALALNFLVGAHAFGATSEGLSMTVCRLTLPFVLIAGMTSGYVYGVLFRPAAAAAVRRRPHV